MPLFRLIPNGVIVLRYFVMGDKQEPITFIQTVDREANTRSDSKVMRLVPKKSFILFIHQLKYSHHQSTSLVPAHTFSSGAATVCSIRGKQLEECRLRPALQTSGCLLLIRNGVLSLPILLFEIISRRARDQVSKEAAASP